jgi:predicted NBD/HSP70 family sugar kinase
MRRDSLDEVSWAAATPAEPLRSSITSQRSLQVRNDCHGSTRSFESAAGEFRIVDTRRPFRLDLCLRRCRVSSHWSFQADGGVPHFAGRAPNNDLHGPLWDPAAGMSPRGAARHSDHTLANLERMVSEIRRRVVAHRGHLMEITGLEGNQIRLLLKALLAKGLVHEGEHRDYNGRYPLMLTGSTGHLVGIDMNLDRVTVGVADLEYSVLNTPVRSETDVPIEDWVATLDRIAETVAAQVKAHADVSRLVGIGLGLPGPVQRDRGSPEADHLLSGWKGVPVRSELEARMTRAGIPGLKVVVGNDASLGALGVHTRAVAGNPAKAPEDLLYLRVTSGVGLGVIVKGHLVTGGDGFAGEIGHVQIEPSTSHGARRKCERCGSGSCLEVLASEKAVLSTLQDHAASEGRPGPHSIREIRETDPDVSVVVGRAAVSLGFVLSAAANTLNPRWIVLGGELVELATFKDTFDQTLTKHALAQARGRLRTSTWETLFDEEEFPRGFGRNIGESLTPEMLGAMAFVVDELGDDYLKPKVKEVRETLKRS